MSRRWYGKCRKANIKVVKICGTLNSSPWFEPLAEKLGAWAGWGKSCYCTARRCAGARNLRCFTVNLKEPPGHIAAALRRGSLLGWSSRSPDNAAGGRVAPLIDPPPLLTTSSATRQGCLALTAFMRRHTLHGQGPMEPQERELITTLLTRLQSAVGQSKDAEADALIRQAMTQMPDAPYYLVQTVLIQDLSLHNAQNRIAELEKQLADANAAKSSGSFLGGLLGRGQPAQPAPGSVPPAGPWTRAPQPGYAQPGYAQPGYPPPGYAQPAAAGGMFGGGGNSFLRSAAATAAGVAGGALLFQGISSLFGHGFAGGLGGFGGMGMGGMGMGGGISETVINNYGDQGGGYAGGDYGGGGGGGDYAGGGDYGGGGGDYGGGGDAGGGGGDAGGGGDYGGGGGDAGGGGDYGGGGGGDFGGG